jgi:hypothetical protein
VPIQHSEAARECVIGGSAGFSDSADLDGAVSAAKGPGVLPSVSQPASSDAAATISARRKGPKLLRDFEAVIVVDPVGDVRSNLNALYRQFLCFGNDFSKAAAMYSRHRLSVK